jgi:hypothetical protein
MGYIADYYYCDLVDNDFELETKAKEVYDSYKKGTLFWRTKMGENIPIFKLTNKHIENIINYLMHKETYTNVYICAMIDVFRSELNNRYGAH